MRLDSDASKYKSFEDGGDLRTWFLCLAVGGEVLRDDVRVILESGEFILVPYCSSLTKLARLVDTGANDNTLMTSAMPLMNSLLGRVCRNVRSMYMRAGCQKAPTRFLPAGISIAVLPPIEESTIDSRVVGTCTKLIPRMYVAATYPTISPTTPPPRAMTIESLVHRFCASQSCMAPTVSLDLELSPGGIS